VGRLVDQHGVQSAVRSQDPGLEEAAAALAASGVMVQPYDPEAGARAELGLTGAVAGIAATGSVVLDAAAAGGRGASLLPRVHLCVLAADRLVATTAAVLRSLGGGDGPPSNLVLVTGPSRTGDIEQILTLGVHGPVAVEILLLGAADHPPPGRGRRV
jgi:L-lactate dehydrogenase complex protein LldG